MKMLKDLDDLDLDLDDIVLGDLSSTHKEKIEKDGVSIVGSRKGKVNKKGKTIDEILGLSMAVADDVYCIEQLMVDTETYNDIFSVSDSIQKSVSDGVLVLATFRELACDIFQALFKYNPILKHENDIKLGFELNHLLLKNILLSDNYTILRADSKLDLLLSTLSLESMLEYVYDLLEKLKEKLKNNNIANGGNANDDTLLDKLGNLSQAQEQLDELIDKKDRLEELLKEMKENNSNPSDINNVRNDLNNAMLRVDEAQELMDKLKAEVDDLIDKPEIKDVLEDVSNKVSNKMSELADQVADIRDCIDTWGVGGSEDTTMRVTFDEKKKALDKIKKSPKLLKFSDLIGRLKETATMEQSKKSKEGSLEINDVNTGDNIANVLSSEKMLLCDKALAPQFFKKYSEKELLQYEKSNIKDFHKGPVICCIDTSGSMSGDLEIWSKAFGIALLDVAKKQKRDFACILYDTEVTDVIEIDKDLVEPNKIIDMAEKFSGGGTDFCRPLEEAMRLLNKSKYKLADIVFITDGDCSVSSEFLEKYKRVKKEKEFKTYGILINMGRYSASDETLKLFCDKVETLSGITDAKSGSSIAVKNVFGSI